jgi:hypothetical protein
MSSIRDSYISRWWMPRRGLSRVLSGGSAGSNSNVGHSAAKIDCVSSAQTLIPSTIEIQTIAFLRDSNADGSYWFRRKSIDLNGRAKGNREIAGKAERKKRERERERERERTGARLYKARSRVYRVEKLHEKFVPDQRTRKPQRTTNETDEGRTGRFRKIRGRKIYSVNDVRFVRPRGKLASIDSKSYPSEDPWLPPLMHSILIRRNVKIKQWKYNEVASLPWYVRGENCLFRFSQFLPLGNSRVFLRNNESDNSELQCALRNGRNLLEDIRHVGRHVTK